MKRNASWQAVPLVAICGAVAVLCAGAGVGQAALIAEAGPDKTVALGWDVMLEGSASGGAPPYTYSWSPATGLTDPDAAQPTASPAATTSYTLTVTDSSLTPVVATDTVTVTVLSFNDVPPDFWASGQIMACAVEGIVLGYPGGGYHPERPVSRAQMAVYIARAVAGSEGAIPTGPAEPTFSDVPTDHWAYRYVEYAAAQGIVQGYPGGAYRPDVEVSRGQMAVYIARADVPLEERPDLPGYPPPASPSFSDVTATNDWSWCYRHVEYCAAEGIVQGYWDDTYRPANLVTRDQMAVYIQRALELVVPGPSPFAGTYAASYGSGVMTVVVNERGAVTVVIVDDWHGVLTGSGVLSNAGLLNAAAEGDGASVAVFGLFVDSGGTITASGSLTGSASGSWTGEKIADQGVNAFAGNWSGTYTGTEWGTWEAYLSPTGGVTATAQSPSVGTVSLTGTIALTGLALFEGSGSGIGGPFTITWEGVFYIEAGGAVGAGTWTSTSGYYGEWTGERE
jgi:hypothetical protein